MPDEVISAPSVEPAPAGYTVPAAQAITVKSVRALVDGSGAGSSFLPTLQLVAPSGQVVWEAPTDATVAAGGSADVSWFPGVKGAPAAAPSGGAIAWAVCNFPAVAVSVASGAQALFGSTTGIEHFHTNAPSVYQLALNVPQNRYGIQVLSFGHYMMFASFAVTLFGAGAIDLDISLADGPQEIHTTNPYGVREILSATPIYGDDNAQPTLTSITLVQATTGSGGLPNPTVWEVTNTGANTAHVIGYGYHIFQLDNVDSFVS